MNKLAKKIALKICGKNSTFVWGKILGCSPMEIYIGDYKYCKADPCVYTAIVGSADFSECENLEPAKLKYIVNGNLNVSESVNLSFPNLEKVDGSLFASNSHNLNLCGLRTAKSLYIEESMLESLEKLTSGHLFIKNSIIHNQNPFMKFLYKEESGRQANGELTK